MGFLKLILCIYYHTNLVREKYTGTQTLHFKIYTSQITKLSSTVYAC